jgi:nucleotide-binding universal stress UspA family protein
MFENVVVGVDTYETGCDAIELTRVLAPVKGKITLLYVEVVQSEPTSASPTRLDAERQRFGLERLARLRDDAQITADVERVQAPSVRHGLHDFAADRDAGLIAIGAGRHDSVTRMFLGDEARSLLEDAPCPVAVAPAGYARRSAALKKIGVGYDGSPASERAIAVARKIAADHGASMSVFEAVRAPVYARDIWDVEDEIDEHVEQARRRIAALGHVEPHAEFGEDAVAALRRYAPSVDLLVLGSHRYRRPGLLIERSKAQRLADDPPTPLLVLARTG